MQPGLWLVSTVLISSNILDQLVQVVVVCWFIYAQLYSELSYIWKYLVQDGFHILFLFGTAQLQIQFNLSWCDLILTLHNNSAPAQPPSTTQTLNMYVNGWSKVIWFEKIFLCCICPSNNWPDAIFFYFVSNPTLVEIRLSRVFDNWLWHNWN